MTAGDVWFRAKESLGRVVIWEEPPSGDPLAPSLDPVGNFDLIRFCSDFLYLSVTEEVDVSINHTSLAGVTGAGYSVSNGAQSSGQSSPIADGQIRLTSIELCTHNLGYVPLFDVLLDGRIVSPGLVVQSEQSGARVRRVSTYATTTKIFLREVAISSRSNLTATSRDYRVLIFADPEADPAKPFLRIKPGVQVCLGWGKVDEDQRALRRALVGDATYYVPLDRTVDIRNGAVRNISPIAGKVDSGIYTGNFTSVSAIEVTY